MCEEDRQRFEKWAQPFRDAVREPWWARLWNDLTRQPFDGDDIANVPREEQIRLLGPKIQNVKQEPKP